MAHNDEAGGSGGKQFWELSQEMEEQPHLYEDAAFPTREYEGFTLPAGKYLALRVVIGEGAGRNWWCVVFPPLCAAAAADVPQEALAAGLSSAQVGLITEENQGYVLKSKLVEFWGTLQAALE